MRAAPTLVIKVKGRYKPPGDPGTDKALNLELTAESQQSLDLAVAKVMEIIKREQVRNIFTISSYI